MMLHADQTCKAIRTPTCLAACWTTRSKTGDTVSTLTAILCSSKSFISVIVAIRSAALQLRLTASL